MNNKQIELINKIVKEKKEIELLKQKLEHLQKDYYDNLLKLYDSVDILGKEKEVVKTEIISMQDYKAKRLFRKQR
jgi:hypothetical protein